MTSVDWVQPAAIPMRLPVTTDPVSIAHRNSGRVRLADDTNALSLVVRGTKGSTAAPVPAHLDEVEPVLTDAEPE